MRRTWGAAIVVLVGCGGAEFTGGDATSAGGATSTGGAGAEGGSTSQAGSSSAGSAGASAGTAGRGGTHDAGGSSATGGASAGSGGSTGGHGGHAAGGKATGGAAGSGGEGGLGGSGGATGGAGGNGTSGAGGNGTGGAGGNGASGAGGSGTSGGGSGGSGGGSSLGGSGGGSCDPISAALDVDPWTVAAPSIGAPLSTMVTNVPHTDLIVSSPVALPNGKLTATLRLDWGATPIALGVGSVNVLQPPGAPVVVVDPTRLYQTCETTMCLGGDPCAGAGDTGWVVLQSTDECGTSAGTATAATMGNTVVVDWQAMFDDPSYASPICTQRGLCLAPAQVAPVHGETVLRFVDPRVLEVAYTLTATDEDHKSFASQQVPAVYVANGKIGPNLHVLSDASKTTIADANDGPSAHTFSSAGAWAAWTLGTSGIGVGVDSAAANFLAASTDSARDLIPLSNLGLTKNVPTHRRAYLAFGGLDGIATAMSGVIKKRPPFGSIENPKQGQVVQFSPSDGVFVSGWVLDTTPISSVQIRIDGNDAGGIVVQVPRADICNSFPEYGGCPDVGFATTVGPSGLSPCQHLLQVIATDPDGNSTILGERVIQPS